MIPCTSYPSTCHSHFPSSLPRSPSHLSFFLSFSSSHSPLTPFRFFPSGAIDGLITLQRRLRTASVDHPSTNNNPNPNPPTRVLTLSAFTQTLSALKYPLELADMRVLFDHFDGQVGDYLKYPPLSHTHTLSSLSHTLPSLTHILPSHIQCFLHFFSFSRSLLLSYTHASIATGLWPWSRGLF